MAKNGSTELSQQLNSAEQDEYEKRQVKVYQLVKEEGTWADMGTGQVCCTYLKAHDSMGILVVSEEDSERTILAVPIHFNITYHRHKPTLIVWKEIHPEVDLSLSFKKAEGCEELMGQIKEVQHEPVVLPPPNMSSLTMINDMITQSFARGYVYREKIAAKLLDKAYIKSLFDLFDLIKDLDAKEELVQMFHIFKSFVMFNDIYILGILLGDDLILKLMEVLQYDPDVPEGVKINHREHLTNHNVFKEVIPFDNEELVAKIHQTYRIQYLKDVVLPRALDDVSSLNALITFNHNEIATTIYQDDAFLDKLMTTLKELGTKLGSKSFTDKYSSIVEPQSPRSPPLGRKMARMKSNMRTPPSSPASPRCAQSPKIPLSPPPSPLPATVPLLPKEHDRVADKILELLSFLQELFLLARNLRAENRIHFLSALRKHGLFEVIHIHLDPPDLPKKVEYKDLSCTNISKRQICCLEIISTIIAMFEAGVLRTEMVEEKGKPNSLLHKIISCVIDERDAGVASHAHEILLSLLNVDANQEQPDEKAFMHLFYDDGYINHLASPVIEGPPTYIKTQEHKYAFASVKNTVVEILSYLVRRHGYTIKYFLLGLNVIGQVLKDLQDSHQFLVATCIRFLKSVISKKDEFYHRHVVKQDFFGTVLDLLISIGNKDTLLNSSILDLFEFIRQENITTLITYLVERYEDKIKTIDYVPTFQEIVLKHHQHQDFLSSKNESTQSLPASLEKVDGKFEEERKEEAYFDSDETDDEPATNKRKAASSPTNTNGSSSPLKRAKSSSSPLEYTAEEDSTQTSALDQLYERQLALRRARSKK